MISPELRFNGFDARSWGNLISLFFPGIVECTDTAQFHGRSGTDDDRSEAQGTLFLIEDEHGQLLQAFHSIRGRIRGVDHRGPAGMPALCQAHQSARCVVLREGVLEELSERLALRLQRDDDYLTQWLVLLRVWKEMLSAGLVHVWPGSLANLPLPSPAAARRALDFALPDNRSLVAVLWDRGSPWTAVAMRRRAGALDLVAGPDDIRHWTGPLGGDWRRDYRVIVQAVGQAVATVHLGLFCEVKTLQRLLQNPNPGAWAKAVALRDIIVHPAPPYVPMVLGTDALRALWRAAVHTWSQRRRGEPHAWAEHNAHTSPPGSSPLEPPEAAAGRAASARRQDPPRRGRRAGLARWVTQGVERWLNRSGNRRPSLGALRPPQERR